MPNSKLPQFVNHPPFIGETGYLQLLDLIMKEGVDHATKRTGEVTRGVVSQELHFDLSQGFPMITTKRVPFGLVAGELLFFIEGGKLTDGRMSDKRLLELSNAFSTKEKTTTIWTENAEAPSWKPKAKFDGDLGRIYGAQWRSWTGVNGVQIDQLSNLIKRLQNDRGDRRSLVSAWNPGEFDDMSLPPCHVMFQVKVLEDELALIMYQRSADMFLGVPFNIASYALLAHIIGQILDVKPTLLTIKLGDAHIYHNHFDQVKEQLSRELMPLPQLKLNTEVKDIDGFTPADISLENYESHGALKAPMAVDKVPVG